MSALAFASSRSIASPVLGVVAAMRRAEPGFFSLGFLLALAIVPTLSAIAVDARQIPGIELWEKPLKFEIALSIYLLSLAFFAQFLPAGISAKRWYQLYSGAVVSAVSAEIVWVSAGAGLGTLSHFNTTPLGTVVYGFMGFAAVLLTSAAAVYAVQIARNGETGLAPAVKEAVVIGLALVLPLTLVTAGTMSSMGGHFVGGVGTDAATLPLMGWALDRGDLRVAHFFATHALHFVPLAGIVSARVWGGMARLPVRLFAVCYTGLVAALFVQALAGRPFLQLW